MHCFENRNYLEVGLENKGLTENESGAKSGCEKRCRAGENGKNEREPTPENVGNPCIGAPQLAGAGLEPATPITEHRILSPVCLPFPPSGRGLFQRHFRVSIEQSCCSCSFYCRLHANEGRRLESHIGLRNSNLTPANENPHAN